MSAGDPRAKPGSMGGWKTRSGDNIQSWAEFDRLTQPGPASYVSVDSLVPARVQLAWHAMRLFLLRVLS